MDPRDASASKNSSSLKSIQEWKGLEHGVDAWGKRMNGWCAAAEDEWLVLRQDELPNPIFLNMFVKTPLHISIFKRWVGLSLSLQNGRSAKQKNNGKMTYAVYVIWFVLKRSKMMHEVCVCVCVKYLWNACQQSCSCARRMAAWASRAYINT